MENEFNDVISELAKIDKVAQGYAADTDSAKEQLLADYQKKKDDIDAEFKGVIRERLDAYKKELLESSKLQSDALQNEFDENMAKLEKSFAENHTKWAQEIADSIVSDHSL